MLHAGKRQRGVTLDKWLLRGPSYKAMPLTNTTEANVPRTLECKQSGTICTRTSVFRRARSQAMGQLFKPA